jgi:hypothetical protein
VLAGGCHSQENAARGMFGERLIERGGDGREIKRKKEKERKRKRNKERRVRTFFFCANLPRRVACVLAGGCRSQENAA